MVETQDPLIQLESLNMWVENLPQASNASANPQFMDKADNKINQLVQSQQQLQFDADSLALARDASQLASLYKEEQQSERANRLAKVMHLKTENNMGSSIITQHMLQYCHHVSGPKNELIPELEKVGQKNQEYHNKSPSHNRIGEATTV